MEIRLIANSLFDIPMKANNALPQKTIEKTDCTRKITFHVMHVESKLNNKIIENDT